MTHTLTPFEVAAASLAERAEVRFVRLMPGIATRHADTIDCFFRVNGQSVTVAISCPTLAELREHENKTFTDQQLVEIAGRWLRRTLEGGYDAVVAELPLAGADFRRTAQALHYL